jgi:hypothetical protein
MPWLIAKGLGTIIFVYGKGAGGATSGGVQLRGSEAASLAELDFTVLWDLGDAVTVFRYGALQQRQIETLMKVPARLFVATCTSSPLTPLERVVADLGLCARPATRQFAAIVKGRQQLAGDVASRAGQADARSRRRRHRQPNRAVRRGIGHVLAYR